MKVWGRFENWFYLDEVKEFKEYFWKIGFVGWFFLGIGCNVFIDCWRNCDGEDEYIELKCFVFLFDWWIEDLEGLYVY